MSKFTTSKLRASFVSLTEPNTLSDKYQLDLIIEKDSPEIKKIKKAIDEATEDGIERLKAWNGKKPAKFFSPLKDGDEKIEESENPEKYAAYEGAFYITPKANKGANTPGGFYVFDQKVNPIEPDEIYSGCYVKASLEFFPYAHDKGGKGVSIKLAGLQFVADGESLGGGFRTEDDVASDFEAVDTEDDDF